MQEQPQKAGEAFLVNPPGGVTGPGVLVLHSWWGLTAWVREYARLLSTHGYTVLAPDLLQGQQPSSREEGEKALAEISPDDLSGLIISSAHTLRAATLSRSAEPIGVVGFSMGGSMALWLAARLPGRVSAAVTYYGTQSIDFDEATADFMGHFGTNDHMVGEEDRVVTESFIRLGGRATEFHNYEGAGHWFAEPGDNFSESDAELAQTRTLDFLAQRLHPEPPSAV